MRATFSCASARRTGKRERVLPFSLGGKCGIPEIRIKDNAWFTVTMIGAVILSTDRKRTKNSDMIKRL